MDVQIDLSQEDGIDVDINLHARRSLNNDESLRKWKSPVKEEIFCSRRLWHVYLTA